MKRFVIAALVENKYGVLTRVAGLFMRKGFNIDSLTVGETEKTMDFGVQTDRYADQLLDLAAIIRGEKPNDQDYDRDLKTHEITLKACGL